jgi:TRAP-type C4-dicarboxylate transport system substrate-binding protein
MATEWREISDGRINLRIYPGGIAGGEADVIRKMRIGQIDMAVLTSTGMTAILPDSFAMSIPFLLETEEELDFIVDEVSPTFDEAFRDKGFVVLTWSKSGWVNIFSNQKIMSPADLAQLKFAGSVTQPGITEAFKKMGFNVIAIDIPDVLMGLQSGMVDALYAPPMAAASFQWFALANNMLDMKLTPLLGGMVITEKAWRRIPERYHEELIASAKRMAGYFYEESVEIEKKAISVMEDNSLQINTVSPEVRKQWRDLMGEDYSVMVGEDGFVSAESFRKVQSMLEDFKNR